MPTDLNFELYFNIAFFSALGLGILFGFLRGLRNSLWHFVFTLVFFAFFFITIESAVNILWRIEMPFLGNTLGGFMPSLSNITTISEALPILLGEFLPEEFTATLTNENLLELATSIGLFVVKIVYTILYFTVIQLVYRLIIMIIKFFVFPSKKKTDKYKSKNRGMGAVIGLLQGAMSVYITLIILGGVLSIGESVAGVMPEIEPETTNYVEFRYEVYDPTFSVIEMAEAASPVAGAEESLELINNMVEAYNTNAIVVLQNQVTMTNPYDETQEMPLNLYLFDSVLSMNYQQEQIAIRNELDIIAEAASDILASDFIETQNLNDIESSDIRTAFTTLSNSNLLTTILPVAIEVGSEAFEVPLEMPLEDLYAIEWDLELAQLGEVAAVAFDIVNAAGALDGEVDLETVTIDGDDVQQLFYELGDSQLITLGAYVAMDPLLESLGEDVSVFITVPEDMNWRDEFRAIGALAGSVISSGLTVNDVASSDVNAILQVLGDIDFTLIAESDLISNAMVNILSGETTITIPDLITIPADIEWYDKMVDGELVRGELYNILQAVNSLASSASELDFASLDELSLNTLSKFTADDINAIFESKILVATVTSYISDLDLGDGFTIVMPDSIYDEYNYIKKEQLTAVVDAVFMLVNELPCAEGDTECEAIGIDINAIFTLEREDIETLTASDILAASAGSLILDLGSDMLTVPGSCLETIQVDGVDKEIVKAEEIENVFLAIATLEIQGIDDLDISPDILTNLADPNDSTILDDTKTPILFGSKILNATLSSYLLDYANGDEALIVVPYFEEDNLTAVRYTDPEDQTEYISQTELTDILGAILVLDIDFEQIDDLPIGNIMDNTDKLFESAILHATVTNMLYDYEDLIVIPEYNLSRDAIKIIVGSGDTETKYIARDELEKVFDAFSELEITNFENVSMSIDILNNLESETEPNTVDSVATHKIYDSAIINATFTKYLVDFSEEENAVVVVPYRDELGNVVRTKDAEGYSFISENEINNILEAVFVLDFEDFNDFSSFEMDTIITNSDVLLGSAILHATVSKQLFSLDDVIVVPSVNMNDDPIIITTGDPITEAETDYISEAELLLTFDAIEELGLGNLTNPEVSMDLLNDLAEPGTDDLDTARSDIYFRSTIINATLSKYVIDLADEDEAFIVLSQYDESGNEVIYQDDGENGTNAKIFTQTELTNILTAVLKLNLADFSDVSTMQISDIFDEIDYLLASVTLQASVTKMLMDYGSDVLVIPTHYENGDELVVTQASFDSTSNLILQAELLETFEALDQLQLTDLDNSGVNLDFLINLSEEGQPTVLDTDKSDELFESTIFRATLSSYIIGFSEGESSVLVVPQKNEADTFIKTESLYDGTEFISDTELEYVLAAILALQLDSFDTTSFDIQTILDEKDTILNSCILQATISEQVLNLESQDLLIPNEDQDFNDIIITTGETVEDEETFLTRAELSAVLEAIGILSNDPNSSGVSSLSSTISLDTLTASDINTLVQSTIIQATISKQVIDIADAGSGDTTVIIPSKTFDESKDIVITIEDDTPLDIIEREELEYLVKAFLALGFADLDDVESSLSISNLATNSETIFDSSIIQATVTNQIVPLASENIVIPTSYRNTDTGLVEQLLYVSGTENTNYLIRSELIAIMDALLVVLPDGNSNVNAFSSGTFGLSKLFESEDSEYDTNQTTLLKSAIMHASMSAQIEGIADSGFIEIASTDINGSAFTEVIASKFFIDKEEIKDLINAMDVLGVDPLGNLNEYGGGISFENLATSANQQTLLDSIIMHKTISNKIYDLSVSNLIYIPSTDFDEVAITASPSGNYYITSIEIQSLLTAMNVLGISGDITSFGGSIGLSVLFASENPTTYSDNQDDVLYSAIMHRTITKQIDDLSLTGIIIPETDIDQTDIDKDASGNFFFTTLEIKHFIDALDVLGVDPTSNLDAFGGDISLSALDNSTSQETLLLSAIMHATLSDKLISSALDIPDVDINRAGGAVTIRLTRFGTEFIEKTEMKLLLTALDELDMTNYDSMTPSLAKIFTKDMPVVLDSITMQSTISQEFLASALLYAPANAGNLIISDSFREDITINSVAKEMIEVNELEALMNALSDMGISTFSVSVTGTILNGKTYSELMDIFDSASMHLTAELMIQENDGINSYIPDIATEQVIVNSLYGESDIIIDSEVAYFIVAVNTFGGSLEGTFDSSVLDTLSAAEQDQVITSAIARCKLTPEFVLAMSTNGTPYNATDYETVESGSPDCLTYDAADDALVLYND